MLADVAFADAAQQRVGQRMQRRVGVGVAFQSVGVVHTTPQSHRWSPAQTGARRSPGRCAHRSLGGRAGGDGHIRRRRKLSVGFASLDQLDRQAGPFGHGRIVGQVRVARCGGPLVCGQYFGEAKALRRLRPPQVRALDGGCDPCAGPERFKVSASGTAAMAP